MNCCLSLPNDTEDLVAECRIPGKLALLRTARDAGAAELVPANQEQPQVETHYRLPVRPRLFNWITILLLTAWVSLVAIVAEVSQERAGMLLSTEAIVESLVN